MTKHRALVEGTATPTPPLARGSENAQRPVVGYKLIKAGVTVQPLGAGLALRTADIRAYVRLHNRPSGEIVFAHEISTSVSDLVPFTLADSKPTDGWDDQPDGWMILQVKFPSLNTVRQVIKNAAGALAPEADPEADPAPATGDETQAPDTPVEVPSP
jgi:hypothetical protein